MQKSVQARYFVTRLKLRKSLISRRAGNRVRTDDLLITNQLLYQLSYAGFSGGEIIPAVAPASKRNLSCRRAHQRPLGQVKPSEAIDKSTAPKEVVLSNQRLNPAAGSGQDVHAVQQPASALAPVQREALPQLVSFYAQVQSPAPLPCSTASLQTGTAVATSALQAEQEMLKNGGLPVYGVIEYDRRGNKCFLN